MFKHSSVVSAKSGYRSLSLLVLPVLAVLALVYGPARAATIYVNAARSDDSGDGVTSWATAKQTLGAALSQAASGDEIWVVAGTYKPTTSTDQTISFVLKAGVGVYGGFAGGETTRDQRNWTANVTTLSGDIGNIGDNSDNSYHVVIASGDMVNAVFDGFTVSGGNAIGGGMWPNDTGGGAFFSSVSRLTIINCTFCNNTSAAGGGMCNYYSSLSVANCSFSSNISPTSGSGGGMYNFYSSPTVTNCKFSNNTATGGTSGGAGGGGMNNYDSAPSVTNCIFSGNTAGCGGGMVNNEALGYSPVVTNCTFSSNIATLNGSTSNGNPGGGGMYNVGYTPVVTNCTFSGNTAYYGGGIDYYMSTGPLTVKNCILWGDTATSGGAEIYTSSATLTLANSCIAGGWVGTGNISFDPLFVSSLGNFHLQAGSPCIDAGSNAAVPAGVFTDLDGNRRIDSASGVNPIVDMGAYEQAYRPWAVPDTASTLENVAVTIPVLANDIAFNGGTLSIIGVTSSANCSVSIAGTQVIYTPNTNFHGSDSFTYTISAGTGLPDTGTVTVTVTLVNQAPTLDAIADLNITEDSGAQMIGLSGITSGPAIGMSDGPQTLTVSTSVLETPGLLSMLAINYTSPNETGIIFLGTAQYKYGSAKIRVTVHDDGGTANGGVDTFYQDFTVNVAQVHHPPTANGEIVSTLEDVPLEIVLDGNDVDGNPLNYTILSAPTGGSLSAVYDGNKVLYTPPPQQSGVFSFSYKVDDGLLESNPALVTIQVTPGAASTLSDVSPTAAVVNGSSFTLTITGAAFVPTSVVNWGGVALPTQYISATQVQASVATANLSAPGIVPITVVNPPPVGGTSNSLNFYVYSGPTVGTWIVTNTNDAGQGSLRQALDCHRNGDTILFDSSVFALSNSDAATTINIKSVLPVMDKGNVTIDAQDMRVTVNGSAAGSADGLVITSNGNTVMGLTVVSFTGSGIVIQNSQNNVIGGNRLTGAGPNGQGLRIGNNGAYGIYISGANATGNVVKGCWIGLSASGQDMHSNLAGILLENGANGNTIGSTTSGELNTISGNSYEGLTVSGTGTDNNVINGNIIGAAAVTKTATGRAQSRGEDDISLPSRSAVSNGSAGVFLSKGTVGTLVGGTGDNDGNLIAHNGGNGIEVHTPNSIHNSVQGNIISLNQQGGIALFDGSNQGVQPPAFTQVQRLPSPPATATDRASVRIYGTAPSDGNIEVFSDAGMQGGTLLGRCSAANGVWQIDVNVSDVENITATLTDVNANTSPFAVFGLAPAAPLPAITSQATASATAGLAFNYTITASNNPTSFAAANLPEGLVLDSSTGVISGVATTGGSYAVGLSASNAFGTGTLTLSLTVSGGTGAPAITSSATANGTVGITFNYGISVAGATPITFGAQNLPPGLALNGALITGTPTQAGMFSVSLTASNSYGAATATLTVSIAPPATPGDSDGDGISNSLEALAGTDPNNATDSPIKEGAVVVDKISAGVSFTSATKDNLTATLRLNLPAGYVNTGAFVAVQFADYSERFTQLSAKGLSPKGLATMKVMGALTTPGPATGGLLNFSVKGKDLSLGLASAGLSNRTTAGKQGETLTLPVAVAIGLADGAKYVYVGSVNVLYKAVQGKTGKAGKAK